MSRTKTSLDILLEIQKRNPSSPRIHPSVSPLKRGCKAVGPGPCWPWLLLQHLIGPRPKPSGWIPSCKWSQCRDSHVPTPGTWGFHNDDKTLKCWPPSYAAIGLEIISVTAESDSDSTVWNHERILHNNTTRDLWNLLLRLQIKGKQRCPSTTGCRCKARMQLPSWWWLWVNTSPALSFLNIYALGGCPLLKDLKVWVL